jgi:ligand-binding sensor domain-containing protein/signal transduction histidine kinase/CheY-like chemotaxis protein/AraC-like DNA-binding protein
MDIENHGRLKSFCSLERSIRQTMRLLPSILLLLIQHLAFSQIDQYKLYNISSDEGLFSNNVQCLYRDSFGFLWIASWDGLTRWDGHQYRKYVHQDKDPGSISQNIVYCVFEDSQRRLWIGSIGGLDLYHRETDSFERKKIRTDRERIPLNAITEDRKGQLWLGTSDGLCCYNPVTEKMIWHWESTHPDSLSENVIFAMVQDKHDNLWIGTFNHGVAKYSMASGKFQRFGHEEGNPATVCSNKIETLLADHEGNVWVGSFDKGVTKLSGEGKVLKQYGSPRASEGTENSVLCLYEDRMHTIWLGKSNELVQYFSKNKNDFVSLEQPAYKKYHIQCTSLSAMCEDDFGNTWFGSYTNGLFYTNKDKNIFRHYYYNYLTLNQLHDDVVTCFYQQDKHKIWIGTKNGLNLFDPSTGTFKYYDKKNGLKSNYIHDIKQDKTGKLWIATWNGGLVQMDPRSGKIKNFTHEPDNQNSLIFNNIKSLVLQDSILWIGTHGEGLCVYDLRTGKFIHHRNNKQYPFNMQKPSWINHLFLDSQNRLWIGTYGGLFMYDQKEMHVFEHTSDTNSLSNHDVNMIAEDPQGGIWIATEAGGVNKYLSETNNFQRFLYHKLPLVIKGLLFDQTGRLWLSGNEGLRCIDPATGVIEHYDESDGLQSNSFFLKSIMKDSSGNLYVGGINGFNTFHPSAILHETKPSVFYFTDLYIFDQVQKPGVAASPLRRQLSYADELKLSFEQSFFTVHFTLVDFYSSAKTRFSYKLEGLHDEWISLGTERKISFTELPPGHYSLKVKYSLRDGSWKEADLPLNIVISPPWWNSGWFRILLFGFVGLCLALLYSARIRSIKRRNEVLEQEVEERTKELSERNSDLQESNEEIKQQNEKLEIYTVEVVRQSEKILQQQEFILSQNETLAKLVDKLTLSDETKNLFFTILAHDLKGPVNAIESLTSMLADNLSNLTPAEVKEFSRHIQKSSTTTRELLYNLLDWARTQTNYLDYLPVDINVYDLVVRNIAVLEQLYRQKEILVVCRVDREHSVFADSNMLDTALRNLLSNAIKFTPEKGSIYIDSILDGTKVEIKVTDTGIGIDEEEFRNLFQLDKRFSKKGTRGESGTGLGLIIVKEFVEINKGTISVESTGPAGTTFVIKLPRAEAEIPAQLEFQTNLIHYEEKAWENELTEAEMKQVKGNRILLVEDNLAMRNHLKYMLASIFEIIEAANGAEALKIAPDMQPMVVITDMVMPVMDGLEFCRTLKNNPETSHIPVIILTSHDNEESELSGYYAGADIYLTKPVRKEVLLQVILNILKGRELFREKLLAIPEELSAQAGLNPLDNEFLEKINAFIETHIANQELDVNQLVRHLGMSRSVLYSKFKAITGQGVNEYIRMIKLRKSTELLIKGSLTVNEIADAVGFNSASYFIRCFVKAYGCTPGEFGERRKK